MGSPTRQIRGLKCYGKLGSDALVTSTGETLVIPHKIRLETGGKYMTSRRGVMKSYTDMTLCVGNFSTNPMLLRHLPTGIFFSFVPVRLVSGRS